MVNSKQLSPVPFTCHRTLRICNSRVHVCLTPDHIYQVCPPPLKKHPRNESLHAGCCQHHYPPPPLIGVPAESATIERMHEYCKSHSHFKHCYPPEGCGPDDETVRIFCDLHRRCNRVDTWADDFVLMQDHYQSWRFANKLSQEFGRSLDKVMSLLKFGDSPGWVVRPNDDIVLVQQPCPSTTESLRALAKSFSKMVRGKSSDSKPSSMCDGPSTSPLAMMHCAPRRRVTCFRLLLCVCVDVCRQALVWFSPHLLEQ